MGYRSLAGLLALASLWAGGCESMKVENPRYAHWSDFGKGSSVTYDGRQTSGEEVTDLHVTDTLVEKGFSELVLERQIQAVTDGKSADASHKIVVKRWIAPEEHPMTHPKAVIRHHGEKTVTVAGKSLKCQAVEVDVDGTFGELISTPEDVDIDTLTCPEIPGGIVEVKLTNKTNDHNRSLSAKAVAFEAK